MTILFTGMCSRHYTHPNLSVDGQVRKVHPLTINASVRLAVRTPSLARSTAVSSSVLVKFAPRVRRPTPLTPHNPIQPTNPPPAAPGAHPHTPPHIPPTTPLSQRRAFFLFSLLAMVSETAVFLELGLSVFSGQVRRWWWRKGRADTLTERERGVHTRIASMELTAPSKQPNPRLTTSLPNLPSFLSSIHRARTSTRFSSSGPPSSSLSAGPSTCTPSPSSSTGQSKSTG